ncbi:MAG: alpha/beta fold hydrolase, partial [Pseudomonadota bacterium]
VVRSLATFFVVLYMAVLAALYFLQDSLMFPAPPFERSPLPSNAVAHSIQTTDGKTLRPIELQASDAAAPYVLFFHGNGGSAERELPRASKFVNAGFNVLLAEYRGYGGSSGSPTAENLLADALLQFDWLREQTDARVYVKGHSLGSGAAMYVAANRDVRAVLLEAPYTSTKDIAQDAYPFVPVGLLFKHNIPSNEFIKDVIEPIMILHGTDDRVIPIRYGKALHEISKKGSFVEIPGAGHWLPSHGSVEMAIEFFKSQD